MMKQITFGAFALLLLAASTSLTSAQQKPNNYNLYLKSGTISIPEGPTDLLSELRPSDTEAANGFYYRIIQFETLPTKAEKLSLENAGVSLVEYIPRMAFLASVSSKFDVGVGLDNVRAIIPLDARMKIDLRLADGFYEPWVMVEDQFLDVIVKHIGTNLGAINSKFMAMGYDILDQNTEHPITRLRIPYGEVETIAALPFVQFVEPIPAPGEPEDIPGRSLHRVNTICGGYGTGRDYDGTGVKVAVNDDGFVGPHIDFTGRTHQSYVMSGSDNDHGDMVAGIVGGAGNLRPVAQGMAPGAFLHIRRYNASMPNTEQLHQDSGIMVFSTSYSNGCNAGYTTVAQLVDTEIRENPALMQVFSAGNNNNQSDCGYGAGNQWGNITGGHKIGKNVIATGNLDDSDDLTLSSSRGPAEDGRLKPDICANGTNQLSTDPGNGYSPGGGTSAAAPGIAGALATLYHAYRELNGGDNPESALLKATIMNTAFDLGNPGPDFKFGWGRINAFKALRTLEENNYQLDSVDNAATTIHNITVPAGTKQLKVMLYWADYEGAILTAQALVNNLDMEVDDPTVTTFYPLVLDHTPIAANLNMNAVQGLDSINNVEQVTIDNPVAGVYTIRVAGTEVPMGPQRYYLVYEFVADEIMVTYPIGGEGIFPGMTELIRWDAPPSSNPFTVEYSVNGGATWTTIGSGINASLRQRSWSVPAVATGEALIRVSDGVNADTSDTHFTIVASPSGLAVDFVCPDSIGLIWNPVSGATSYEVSTLGAMYMDSIGTSPITSFVIQDTILTDEHWFSVKALGPNGIIGERANAIYLGPGVQSCMLGTDAMVESVVSPLQGAYPECVFEENHDVTVNIANPGLSPASNIPVHYKLNNNTVVSEIYTGTIAAGGSANYTFTDGIVGELNYPGTNKILAWTELPGDGNNYNDTTVGFLEVVSSTFLTFPWSQNFESFSVCGANNDCEATTCNLGAGWTNVDNLSGDDLDFRVDLGGTPSTGTGPTVDANPGTTTGRYLYTEASFCFEKTALLVSPCLDLTGTTNPHLAYSYHMSGGQMGALHLDVFANGAWNYDVVPVESGNHGSSWQRDSVDLSPWVGATVAVQFRAVTGSGYESDIALDNIGLYSEVDYTAIEELHGIGDVNIFPNPARNTVNIQFSKSNQSAIAIQILDMEGRIIVSETLGSTVAGASYQISTAALSAGLYTVDIGDHSLSKTRKRLVILGQE